MVYKAIIRLKNNEKRCLLLVEYVKSYILLYLFTIPLNKPIPLITRIKLYSFVLIRVISGQRFFYAPVNQ